MSILDDDCYDKDGNPITYAEYHRLRWLDYEPGSSEGYYRVALTCFPDGTDRKTADWWVSTVWLGLDHSFGIGRRKPLIFETKVFGKGVPDGLDDPMWRYTTLDEAIQGHQDVVSLVQATLEASEVRSKLPEPS
jgi:hypothetical protein